MKRLNIALVAHDARKQELIEWCRHNIEWLGNHKLFATGTTGNMIKNIDTTYEPVPNEQYAVKTGPLLDKVNCLLSGPLGGDQQIGSRIVEGNIDFVVFFWDPLESQPHDPDVKALLRIAVVYDIPVANNRATADFLLNSKYYLSNHH